MKKFEQLSRHDAGPRRYLKRAVARMLRRAARRDPEGAPVRAAYLGYTM